jgi:uncharacterized membrane protein
MLNSLYRRRLERDLEVWLEKGWVTREGAAAILGSVADDGRARTAAVIGFLGAVLIAMAAIAFVASNWQDFPRPLRMLVLVAGMALAYGIAGLLARARHPHFADAAVFAGTALFGASIVLVAQSYHLSGDYPDALLLWGAGALLAAAMAGSRASLVLALVVFCLWSWYEVTEFGWIVHWPFIIALAAVTATATWWRWGAGLHLSALAFIGWTGTTIVALAWSRDWSAAATVLLMFAIGIATFGAGRFAAVSGGPIKPAGRAIALYGLAGMMGTLVVLQLLMFGIGSGSSSGDAWPLWGALGFSVAGATLLSTSRASGSLLDASVLIAAGAGTAGLLHLSQTVNQDSAGPPLIQMGIGVLALVVAVWAISFGNRSASRTAANLGLVAFAIEVLYIYWVTFGTLLDTALFFLVGGVLLIGLAAVLVRLQRRLKPADAEAS